MTMQEAGSGTELGQPIPYGQVTHICSHHLIPLLKRVCIFNRAEQGICKCGLYITASTYIP